MVASKDVVTVCTLLSHLRGTRSRASTKLRSIVAFRLDGPWTFQEPDEVLAADWAESELVLTLPKFDE